MSKFVFVMAPPYSGSTVLTQLLETSEAVSALPGEGQFLPEVRDVMRLDPWGAHQSLPWDAIREVWEAYWDMDRPLLLEKSPPNLIKSAAIEAAFDPAWFILMMREPYAHIEGLARRPDVPPMELAKRAAREDCIARAAECWIMFARAQAETLDARRHAIWFTYEEMTQEPGAVATKLQEFLPELGALDTAARFGVHSVSGTAARELEDMNEDKRKLLTARDFAQITEALRTHADLLNRFGYTLRDPAPDQDQIARKEKAWIARTRALNNLKKVFQGSGKKKPKR